MVSIFETIKVNADKRLEYLEPFNCVQTKVILVCKQISSDSFINKISHKLLIYKSYI